MADSPFKESFNNNLSPDDCQSLLEFQDPILTPTIMEDPDSILEETEVENTVPASDHNYYEVVEEAPLMQDQSESHPPSVLSPRSEVSLYYCDTSNYNSTYAKSTASDTIDVELEQLPHLPVTNHVEISTIDTKDLDLETKTSILDIEEPALEAQEDNLITFSGSCLEDLHSDQGIADPFHEEFLNFNNLFPNLIPGVDNDACQLQPEIPPDFILPKEKLPLSPIIDIMEDLDSILKETEVDENTVPADDHNSYLEVVEEAPLMQDQTESNPPSVLSPGSVVSLDSCDTSNYNSTYAESTASDNIDMELEQLLQLLATNPVDISIDAKDLDFETKTSTLDAEELALEIMTSTSEHAKQLPLKSSTNTVKTLKCKCTTSEEPVAKRTKSDAVKTTDKVTERRIKNNAASRICRASRKQREEELFKREEELITSNQELRSQVEQLTKETESLREILVQRLTGCSN